MPNAKVVRETLSKWSLSESLDTAKFLFASAFVIKTVGSVYYSWDPLMRDTIYYLIIVIYYFWYFYVKNVILGLGDLFPCF